jgi:predicted RNase H-like nuclease
MWAESSVEAFVAPDIELLVTLAGRSRIPAAVAIDMPIGLPDHGRRQADMLAKAVIGPLRSSVFVTPVREALRAENHATAVATNRRIAGEGISIQAFGLKAKLFEIEAWALRSQYRVIEVHPEVSFATLAGQSLTARKSTWAGMHQRLALLDSAGIRLRDDFGSAGAACGVDDMLDAAVSAWTARRFIEGKASPLPDPPERFSDGLASAIWA